MFTLLRFLFEIKIILSSAGTAEGSTGEGRLPIGIPDIDPLSIRLTFFRQYDQFVRFFQMLSFRTLVAGQRLTKRNCCHEKTLSAQPAAQSAQSRIP
jgi:hypothetical protein